MTFKDKRKNIHRRVYAEKEFNNYLAEKYPPSLTKCGLTAAQIMDRWSIPRQQAYGLTRRYGIRVIDRLVIPYDVTQSPEFRGAISVILKKQARRRQDE